MPKIALFGATGQLGTTILATLLPDPNLQIHQIIAPGTKSKVGDGNNVPNNNLSTAVIDLTSTSRNELAKTLQGVDVVVSALNGKGLESQGLIQDAAWDAGVRRFFPSEYGMPHVYRGPGVKDGAGWIHPMWNTKLAADEAVLHHPAIVSGAMTYTLIGCGDFYNQPRERVWCPWAVDPTTVSDEHGGYVIHVIGDPGAKIDFTHTHDFAAFLHECIKHPEVSENRCLNFVSDHISYVEIADLLKVYTDKKVHLNILSLDVMHRTVRDPSQIPRELHGPSAFPVDFWVMVKGVQGEGRFWRPPGQVHNHLFPGVKTSDFEGYIKGLWDVTA